MPNPFAFLSYVMLTTFTPGPNNIMSMSTASKYGFRKSLRFTSGVFAGFCLFMATVSFVATSSWALFGSIFERFLAQNGRVIAWIMAGLLVYCAVSLF